MIGKTISHYKILEKIGSGGMGIVYKAQDLKLDRFVALKFLPPHLTTSEKEKQRFIHEAKAASTLEHNNICNIHEIDETEDGQLFISMAYYEGETLDKKIKEKPYPIDEAIGIAIQVAQGLAKAHEKDIVHRDIKPANIMLTSDGVVKILDFGLAKLSTQTKLTKESTTLGTVSYMSTEQAKGEDADYRTDIWSLGIIIYEMLTGQLPFKGEYESAVIYSILNDTQEPVTGLRTGMPMELERIINKCLKKNPTERYQHVDELIVDLQGVKRQSDTSGIPSTKAKQQKLFKSVLLPIAIISIIILIIVGYFLIQPGSKRVSEWENSIAVLPFTDLSANKDQEWFCDGITEDIIAHLSKISDLKVISRTSTMQYNTVKKSPPEIAEEFNVTNVLKGTVRRSDARIRIFVELIDAKEDKNIWAETYDREIRDIFAIQSDVAEKIASVLKVELSPKELSLIQKKPTENLAAYNFYIKGREYYYRYQKEDNLQAIRMYKKALEVDPNYALAYAGLGDAYAQGYSRFGFSSSWIDSALKVSKKAIEIDPNSSEAYKALGTAYSVIDRTSAAIDAYKKSIELNPGNDMAAGNLGNRYLKMGQLREALKWNLKKEELNPISATGHVQVGIVYTSLCEDFKAQRSFEKAIEIDPKMAATRTRLIDLYLAQKDYKKALATAKEILNYSSDTLNAFTYIGYVEHVRNNTSEAYKYFTEVAKKLQEKYFYNHHIVSMVHLGAVELKRGNDAKAKKIFSEFLNYANKEIDLGNESWEIPYNVTGVYSVLGDKDKAFHWLDRTIESGWRNYRIGIIEPLFENIRQDSRFEKRIEHVEGLVDKARERIQAAAQ
jgi:serine/threonine protein kinase/tetratricopeptide (TPR) repeat protein